MSTVVVENNALTSIDDTLFQSRAALERIATAVERVADALGGTAQPAPAPRGRTFWADVALLGHHDLGVCKVEELRLGGRDLLRVTPHQRAPRWINPAAIYSLEECADPTAPRPLDEPAQSPTTPTGDIPW